MHKKRIRQLASAIEIAGHTQVYDGYTAIGGEDNMIEAGVPDRFNMTHFSIKHDCGTAGCIGGFAISMFGEKGSSLYRNESLSWVVAHLLGVSVGVAEALCIPSLSDVGGYFSVSAEQGAQAVLNLLDERVLQGELHPWHHLGVEVEVS